MFAFQHAQFVPARWPDPRYPAQLHLDMNFDEGDVFEHAERWGAVPLVRPDRSEGVNGMGRPMRTYGDPAGHPFCIGAFA
jgi:hypothetical protein